MPSTKSKPAVTIWDVARETGHSKSTVARVLSGRGYAASETSAEVLDAAKRLGYEVNEQAQRLVRGRYDDEIDIFTYELDFGVVLRKVKTIRALLMDAGYDVAYHVAGSNRKTTVRTIAKLRRRKPRAIVSNGWGLDEEALAELRRYVEEGGVLACFCFQDALPLECDQVVYDEFDSTYQAVKYLLERGHRKIGFNAQLDKNPDHPRIRGMRHAMAEYGAPVREDWIFFSDIYEFGGEELAEKFLALEERPTALCINNDVTAATFVQILARRGVRVPDDVSVIGHDDSPSASRCLVPLTVVDMPIWPDCRQVVGFLKERLDGYAGAPRIVTSRGQLIERESVASVG